MGFPRFLGVRVVDRHEIGGEVGRLQSAVLGRHVGRIRAGRYVEGRSVGEVEAHVLPWWTSPAPVW